MAGSFRKYKARATLHSTKACPFDRLFCSQAPYYLLEVRHLRTGFVPRQIPASHYPYPKTCPLIPMKAKKVIELPSYHFFLIIFKSFVYTWPLCLTHLLQVSGM